MIGCYVSNIASVATDCCTATCVKKIICQNMVQKMQNKEQSFAKYCMKYYLCKIKRFFV